MKKNNLLFRLLFAVLLFSSFTYSNTNNAIADIPISIAKSAQASSTDATASTVTFAIIGDFGSGDANETSVANLVKSWNPEFIITTGDDRYGNLNFDDAVGFDYCDFLAGAQSGTYCDGNGATTNSFFPSAGNHEYTDGGGINEYLAYFNLPGSGIVSSYTSGSEKYYDFVQGPIHFFVIDSYDAMTFGSMTAQQNWLQAQLAASTSIWNIVYFHHPPYSSSSSHGSSVAMRWPFASWGADAVLNGHDHTYERLSYDGIPYMVNGLGGKSKYAFGTPISGSIIQYSAEYGAQKVVANETSMTFSFINILGATIDEFTIYKNIPPDNNAPVFTSNPITGKPDAVAAEAYSESIAGDATDADNDPITFSKILGPEWLSVASDGILTGIPGNGDIGSNIFTVQVTDIYGAIGQADLQITVNAAPAPPSSGTFEVRITGANDDVEEKLSDGTMYFESTDIELGNEPGTNGDQSEGLLFRNIYVPQGATITNAYIEFETDETGSGATLVKFSAQDTDNAPDFTSSAGNLTSRSTTSSSMTWDIPAWNTVNEKHRTPDISLVIQEIINRNGWIHNNNLAIIIEGTGTRTAESFNGEPSAAALLHIEYNTTNNNAPVFTSDPVVETSATEDTPYSSSLSDNATDIDNEPLTFSKILGPAWLTVSSNGTIAGTPSNDDVGLNNWTVQVSDGNGGTDQAELQITVINTNDSPAFTSNPIIKPDATAGLTYNESIANDATDIDEDVIQFSKISGPNWLTINSDGTISGTPASEDIGLNSWSVQVSDNFGGSDIATLEITVTDPSTINYCTSNGNATDEWIANVTVGNVSNPSGSSGLDGYEDFTGSSVFTLEPGSFNNIILEPGFLSRNKFEYWNVWIDFNHDGDFEDSGELVFSASKARSTVSGSISIPMMSSVETVMRVSMKRNAEPSPCETFSQGEVEDYTIAIVEPAPVAPVANFSASLTTINIGEVIQFTDLSTNAPTSWLWNFGDGQTSDLQNPSVAYNTPEVYTVSLTTTNGFGSDSEVKTDYITVNEMQSSSYCEPVNIDISGDYIVNVTIGSFGNSSGKSLSGFTLFSDPAFDLEIGQTYNISLTPNETTSRNFWRFWIDANNDGDFDDANETLFAANNKRGIVSGSITIPTEILVDKARLRITMKTGSSPAACDDSFSGEVEDYIVNITQSASVNINQPGNKSAKIQTVTNEINDEENISVSVYPNPANEKVFIQLNGWNGEKEIRLINITGKLIYQKKTTGEIIEINTNSYPKGIYLIEIKDEMQHEVKKIIIQ